MNQPDQNLEWQMDVKPTLNFYGRTEEAIKFYRDAIDAETLFLMRCRDSPDKSAIGQGMDDKVFHATFRVGSTEIMATDLGCVDPHADSGFGGFSLALRVSTAEEAERFFARLSDGGQITVELTETFFASRYGIVIDRFGLSWKIIVESD